MLIYYHLESLNQKFDNWCKPKKKLMDKSRIRVLTDPAVELPNYISLDKNCTAGQFSEIIGNSLGSDLKVYIAIPVKNTQKISDLLDENRDAVLIGGNIQKESNKCLRFIINFTKQQIRTVADFPVDGTISDVFSRYKLSKNDVVSTKDQKLFSNTLLKDIYAKSNMLTIISDMEQNGTIGRNVISKDGKIHTIYVNNDSTLADVARKYIELYGMPLNHNPVFIYSKPEAGALPCRVSLFTNVSELDPKGRLIISFGPKKEKITEPTVVSGPTPENIVTVIEPAQKAKDETKISSPPVENKSHPKNENENSIAKNDTAKIKIIIADFNNNQSFVLDIPSNLKSKELEGYLRKIYGERISQNKMKIKVGFQTIERIDDLVAKCAEKGTINVGFLRPKEDKKRQKMYFGNSISFSIKIDAQPKFDFEGKTDMTLSDVADELREGGHPEINKNCAFRDSQNYINSDTLLSNIKGNLIRISNKK